MYEPGQILKDRYQLQQRLGHTAASRQTWLAVDLASSPAESVILKLLAFAPQMEWQELELFEREAKILRSLEHPGIPRYRDYFSIDRDATNLLPWFVLVQDYIAGHSLRELLNQGKHFSDRQVRQVATNLLNLLCYLHELSPPVLHRDIKPSNVNWGENDYIYLVDFGAVQDRAAVEGVTFTVVGTYGYTPMEQFGGRAVAASDLYALGATLVHLLTGTAPADLPQKDLCIQFADRVSIAPAFVQWITRLIQPDVSKRFQTARQALAALKSLDEQRHSPPSPSASRSRSLPAADSRRAELSQRRSQSLNQAPTPPYDSRIEVQQTADRLLFKLPGGSPWQLLVLLPVGFALAVVGASLFEFLIATGIGSGQIALLVLLILLLVAAFTYWDLLPFFVELDRSRFSIYKCPFGSPVAIANGSTSEIHDVFHSLKTFPSGKSTYEKRVVTIQTYRGEDYFAKGLSWEECDWLVEVMQNWLGLRS